MNDTLREAARLWELGFAIHWLKPKSKRPVEMGWTSGPRKHLKDLMTVYTEGLNLGVRLGDASKIGAGYLAVIDIDVKSTDVKKHRQEALQAVRSLTPDIKLPMVRSGRGNGSAHLYCLTREPFKTITPLRSDEKIRVLMPSKKPSRLELEQLTVDEIEEGWRLSRAWEISLYSNGRQVVLPPSIHPDTGMNYAWVRNIASASDLPLIKFNLPEGEVSHEISEIHSESTKPRRDQTSVSQDFRFRPSPVELSWLPISDKIRSGITTGNGVGDRSSFLLLAANALLSVGLTQDEILSVLTDQDTYLGQVGYDHAQTTDRARAAEWVYRYTLKKVTSQRSVEGIFTPVNESAPPVELTPEEVEKQTAELMSETDWRQYLDRSKAQRTSLKNLDLIFSNAVDGVVFKKDLFANRVAYGCETPWGGRDGEYLQDIDLLLIKRWLADTEFKIEPQTSVLLEVTNLLGHREGIHPVRDWLHSLRWDGKTRINTWIRDYCEGQAEEPYLSEVSRKFLLAMVKRVFEPGCQWDYVLILEGKQGKYKSSIARALASDKWFMDNLPDLKDKDSMLNLQGKWLIELGELTNVKRSDHNLVKAYLVRRTDTVRPPYGRIQQDTPRQSVFIGTVNEGQYLKDPTGNRRFWPVKVGNCDVKGLTRVRDQLFAEAMHVYKSTSEVLMLSPRASAQAHDAQEDRRVDDEETEMREAFADFKHSEYAEKFDFGKFKIKELFTGPGAPFGPWAGKNYSYQNASNLLKNLGFECYRSNGHRFWTRTKSLETTFNQCRGSADPLRSTLDFDAEP